MRPSLRVDFWDCQCFFSPLKTYKDALLFFSFVVFYLSFWDGMMVVLFNSS